MVPKNPYYVLGLTPEASTAEIERQGRKLLGLLEVGAASARTYTCPLGTFDRDTTMVREALMFLRDPRRRSKARCLAGLLPEVGEPAVDMPDAPFSEAFSAGGYRGL